jgi:hypothetical protein
MAFLSGFMMIWLINSWLALGPTSVTTAGSFRFAYFALVFGLFAFFWIYFFRRPHGGRALIDGRTALSGSALIVGVATGYAFIEFGLIASHVGGSFAVFVGCTMLPILAWLAVYLISMFRRHAVLKSQAESGEVLRLLGIGAEVHPLRC